jgi:hypothetical protein
MRDFLVVIIASSTFFCQSCSKQTATDIEGEPTPPRWVEVTTTIDSIPAHGRTGSIQFHFIVSGSSNAMPVTSAGDTLNRIRISLQPDPGRERNTMMSGDTLWEGNVRHRDSINLRTQFTPGTTTFIYSEWVNGALHEFDWAVRFVIEFYHQRRDSSLIGMGGYGMPYGSFNVNTQTGETFIRIRATK